MRIEQTPLQGSYLIEPVRNSDPRGWFMRTYDEVLFKEHGLNINWVQMNHSRTLEKGVVRGMHFQRAPHGEVKLVRCVTGAVWDVIIDLRASSPDYLKWFGAELTADNGNMLYIPQGFAHGFQTLAEDAQLVYLHSHPYVKEAEAGIRFDDPAVNIKWKLPVHGLSHRDRSFELIDNNFKST